MDDPLRRSRTLTETRSPGMTSPMTSPPPSVTPGMVRSLSGGTPRKITTGHLLGGRANGGEQKNARYGSLTDAELGEPEGGWRRLRKDKSRSLERLPLGPAAARPVSTANLGDTLPESMSLAAVDSIQRREQPMPDESLKSRMLAGGASAPSTGCLSRTRRVLGAVHGWLCDAEANEQRLMLLFMTLLGLLSALLTFGMDLAVEKLYNLRFGQTQRLRQMHLTADAAAERSLVWIAHGLFWGLLAVFVTARISPLAAGSGIPEIKSILSGNVLYKYLSKRTLCAKVLGLTCALASGLPLGKEGPFIHASCCLCEAMLSLPLFRPLKASHATRMQMLMAACAVGVGANFGAPVGGVLLAIELTSTYFLVSIYWKCFYTAVVGAVLSRTLYMSYKTKTYIGSATFQSFFEAEDVEAEVVQLPIFVVIGLLSGVLGALFVRANAAWSRFRARRAGSFFFKSKYYLTIVMLLLWGLVTMPDGPVGSYMRKSQMGSLNELFSDTMSDDWGKNDLQLLVNLLIFFVVRFSFTCVGITLPMPAGVFAPSLCAGAGLGRMVGEVVKYMLPEHDTSPGGYAVLGAAAMAAGVTHTISSAVLMFELTGGMKHALPMLLTVVVSYMTSRALGDSIFDSILMMKKLPYLPDFKNRASYHRSAREVLSHLTDRSSDLKKMARVVYILKGEEHSAFAVWRNKAALLRARQKKKLYVANPMVGPTAVSKKERGGGGATYCVYRSMTFAELEHLTAVCTWTFLPWVEEHTQILFGAIRRSAVRALVEARKRKYHLNERVVLSQRFAAHRACNSLHNDQVASEQTAARQNGPLSSSQRVHAVFGAKPERPPPRLERIQSERDITPTAAIRPASCEGSDAPGLSSDGTARRGTRLGATVRLSINRLRTGGVGSLLRSRPTRTLMDDAVEIMPAADSTAALQEESIVAESSSLADLSIEIEDGVSMFGGGTFAPPAVIASAESAADSADALEHADSVPFELAPAPHAGAASSPGTRRRHLGASAALSTSLACLNESSMQVELDRSQVATVDTADGLQLVCTLADYMDVPLSEEDWHALQVEDAPFCIAASASMGQVHFYFSMLLLSCAFVTDRGKYVGMITKTDLCEAGL
ncbi:chloride channel [Pavlovales sp. CCMP2436]|nr:chloride channel [Pavlovales sp. CCMP2436]